MIYNFLETLTFELSKDRYGLYSIVYALPTNIEFEIDKNSVYQEVLPIGGTNYRLSVEKCKTFVWIDEYKSKFTHGYVLEITKDFPITYLEPDAKIGHVDVLVLNKYFTIKE